MPSDEHEHSEGSAPAGIRKAAEYLPRLEAMRGIAILLVVIFHAAAIIRPTNLIGVRRPAFESYVHGGHTGVTLFFVLSAFLLSRPFLRAASGAGSVSARRFWERRALRILPLYWVVVVVSAVLQAWLRGGSVLHGLPYLVFLNSFHGLSEHMFPFSDVWWSLATEAQFYLALPLAGYAARSRTGRWLLVAGLLAYCLDYTLTVQRGFPLPGKVSTSLFGRLPSFVIGIGAAWIYDRYGERLRHQLGQWRWCRWGGADASLIAVVYALGLLLREVTFLGFFNAEVHWHAWHVAEAFCWALVVLIVLVAPLNLSFVFDSRLLKRAGVLSYSLYLLHMPIVFFTLHPLRPRIPRIYEGWNPVSFAAVMLCVAMAIGLSSLTYRFIERPFLQRKARITS